MPNVVPRHPPGSDTGAGQWSRLEPDRPSRARTRTRHRSVLAQGRRLVGTLRGTPHRTSLTGRRSRPLPPLMATVVRMHALNRKTETTPPAYSRTYRHARRMSSRSGLTPVPPDARPRDGYSPPPRPNRSRSYGQNTRDRRSSGSRSSRLTGRPKGRVSWRTTCNRPYPRNSCRNLRCCANRTPALRSCVPCRCGSSRTGAYIPPRQTGTPSFRPRNTHILPRIPHDHSAADRSGYPGTPHAVAAGFRPASRPHTQTRRTAEAGR